MKINKRVINKILKVCGTPENFVFDYIFGASQEADIGRMEEYVNCVRRVKRSFKKKKS